MREKQKEKEIEDIHELYLDGEAYPMIAETLGISLSRVQATVLKYRALDPLRWPKRVDLTAKRLFGLSESDHIIVSARYECTGCGILFNVEMSADILRLRVACPTCQDDEGVSQIGVGYMFDGTLEIPVGNKGKKRRDMEEKMKSIINKSSHKKRGTKKIFYTEEQRGFICYMHDKLTNKDIGAALNRSRNAIDKQVKAIKDKGNFEYYYLLGEKLYKKGTLLDVI